MFLNFYSYSEIVAIERAGNHSPRHGVCLLIDEFDLCGEIARFKVGDTWHLIPGNLTSSLGADYTDLSVTQEPYPPCSVMADNVLREFLRATTL